MGRVWSSVGFQLFFGKQSILAHHQPFTWQKSRLTYSIKDSACSILMDENKIISWKRKCFEDPLNPVMASIRDTHEVTDLEEEKIFTAAEVATASKEIKFGNAAGEDEIRPEVLKALTGEGILCLTRACQVSWKFGKLPEIGKQLRLFWYPRKEIASNIQSTEKYHSLDCQGRYVPNVLKRNAEK